MCAGCDEYAPWGAFIVGSLGGLIFIAIHIAMKKFELDDPVDAVAVHAGGGNGILIILFHCNLVISIKNVLQELLILIKKSF